MTGLATLLTSHRTKGGRGATREDQNANCLTVRHRRNVLQDSPADRKAFFANGSVRRITGRRLQSNNVGSFVAERAARSTYGMMTGESGRILHGIDAETNTLVTDVCAVLIAGGRRLVASQYPGSSCRMNTAGSPLGACAKAKTTPPLSQHNCHRGRTHHRPRRASGDVGGGPHHLAACVFCIATIFHWLPCLTYVIVDRSTSIPDVSLYVNTFVAFENSTATDPKTRTSTLVRS